MIDITDLTVDQLADAWRRVRDASPADEADPFVLDCARRLAADPGGERAHLWVSGLLAMSGHLARRPGRDAGRGGRNAERAALEALRAAAKELGGWACPHEDHPYEAEMDALEDEVWLGDNGLLSGELPAQDADFDAGKVLCPANVAGWARLAVDVIAPLTVRRIPAGAPQHHQGPISTLSGIVNDYPYCDPHEVLAEEAAGLPVRPTRGVLAGYLVTMNATCWYAASERITDRSVPAAMLKGVEAAVALLDDGPCAHGPGGHPDTGDPDHASQIGYLLRSPGGRAEIAEYHGWDEDGEDGEEGEDEPLDAWVCPVFLRELASETIETLTEALAAFEDLPAEGRDRA